MGDIESGTKMVKKGLRITFEMAKRMEYGPSQWYENGKR